jgi:hypothetical protein
MGLTAMKVTKELHYQNILTVFLRPENRAIIVACICHQCAWVMLFSGYIGSSQDVTCYLHVHDHHDPFLAEVGCWKMLQPLSKLVTQMLSLYPQLQRCRYWEFNIQTTVVRQTYITSVPGIRNWSLRECKQILVKLFSLRYDSCPVNIGILYLFDIYLPSGNWVYNACVILALEGYGIENHGPLSVSCHRPLLKIVWNIMRWSQ